MDDFMRTVATMAAWNAQSRLIGLSNDDRVRDMIDSGYSGTRTHIDTIRNDIEV